ncbi:GNAT family N-acetyltransferase, partial [Actinotalea sp. C106]|uniref:GNAT family N-acetyltransferase n=1 Tax=Actinotalea sp. C106 TaxID=2908644 RepID=UPI00202927A2
MSTWSVTRSPVPPSLEDPAAWALHGASAVSFAVDHDTYGYDDVAYTAQYLQVGLAQTEYTTRVLLVAHRSDLASPAAQDVVGLAHLHMQRASNERMAYLELVVHPEHRRQGVGAALLAEAEQVARAHGRSVVIASSDHRGEPPADAPGALGAPTGSGRIDSAEP